MVAEKFPCVVKAPPHGAGSRADAFTDIGAGHALEISQREDFPELRRKRVQDTTDQQLALRFRRLLSRAFGGAVPIADQFHGAAGSTGLLAPQTIDGLVAQNAEEPGTESPLRIEAFSRRVGLQECLLSDFAGGLIGADDG